MVKKYLAAALTGLALLVSSPDAEARPRKIEGIDISHHQGKHINWRKVRRSGKRFVYVKATQGEDYQDPRYEINIRNATRAGLKVGCYHFGTPGTWPYGKPYNAEADAKLEALDFVSRARKCLDPGNMRPALDLENDGSGRINKLSPNELADWVHKWMNTVEKETGAEPIIYGHKYPIKIGNADPDIVKNYDIWLADYRPPRDSGPWRKSTIWQYSYKGKVRGIRGKVDLNKFYGSMKQFRRKMLIRK